MEPTGTLTDSGAEEMCSTQLRVSSSRADAAHGLTEEVLELMPVSGLLHPDINANSRAVLDTGDKLWSVLTLRATINSDRLKKQAGDSPYLKGASSLIISATMNTFIHKRDACIFLYISTDCCVGN